MLRLICVTQGLLMRVCARALDPDQREGGQSTAEYALVIVGAATLAVLLLTWATKSGKIGGLFDLVLGVVMKKFK